MLESEIVKNMIRNAILSRVDNAGIVDRVWWASQEATLRAVETLAGCVADESITLREFAAMLRTVLKLAD